MLPKPRRPREKRIVPLTPVTYSIAEFCDLTGLSKAVVLRSIDDGSLRSVKVGIRRLILAPKWRAQSAEMGASNCGFYGARRTAADVVGIPDK